MARFINTRKAVSEIEDLIRNAGEKLFLVSPYLKLSKDFKELLTYRNSKDKITTVIFGKQELNPDEMKFLQGLRFVILKYNEDLHAKCYVNDEKMVITSLNLYEFSMANNKEMGVLIDKNDPADIQLYEDAFKEVDYINQTSQGFELSAPKVIASNYTDSKPTRDKSTSGQSGKNLGYCIRTGISIPFSVEKPLCYEAFKKWNEYGDPEYPEKFCHFSGEPSNGETSVSRPILKKNWKKAKETFNL
ncbi:MAG: phospholipase D family protein [Saprospiraceae bacterium]|nr:phospholipase D family protein [Candidatus Opimibacter iunctus]